MPELRTPVMILVEASWEDARGVLQSTRARMEDKSAGGACIRFKSPIAPGTKLRVQWRFEQFSGTVKYCRSEGREFVAGIQRDVAQGAALPRREPAEIAPRQAVSDPGFRSTEASRTDRRSSAVSVAQARMKSPVNPRELKANEVTQPLRTVENGLRTRPMNSTIEIPRLGLPYEIDGRPRLRIPQAQDVDTARDTEVHKDPPPVKSKEADSERKPMGHKWLDRMPWRDNQASQNAVESSPDGFSASGSANHGGANKKENVMPPANQPTEKTAAHAREVPNFEVELLAMEDIYRSAGILSPRKGYSINKVVEMLNSEHIRALSKEMKRAAVLMALDAAGISIDQVQRDAKARQSALDVYESEQKKQADAEWARKADEIVHIQAELESIKAHYMGRITRNQEAVARDKARFSNWVATKQQEAQSMTEALDLCLKSQPPEPVNSAPPAEFSLAAGAGLGATPISSKPQ